MAKRSQYPEDAHRGTVAPVPADADEARADRELADAERAVATGTASAEQRERVTASAGARSHEDRRSAWMDSADGERPADPRPGRAQQSGGSR